MRKSLFVFSAVVLVNCAFAGGGSPDATIKSVHAQFEQAMRAGKTEAAKQVILKNFADDFVYTMAGGAKENRAKFIQNMSFPAGMKLAAFSFSLGKITTKGNTATLPSTISTSAAMKDGKGKMHSMTMSSSETETWTYAKGVWKMKSIVEQKQKSSMDGKSVGG